MAPRSIGLIVLTDTKSRHLGFRGYRLQIHEMLVHFMCQLAQTREIIFELCPPWCVNL